jgi:hypothetical protein
MESMDLNNNEKDAKIQLLERDLYLARSAIVGLMSEPKQKILNSYYYWQTRQERYGWINEVAEEIIAMAEPVSGEHSLYFSERAYCPLCGGGTSSPYESGFSLPEGLRRHLTGSGASQCVVTEAASNLARDFWKSKFRETEEREEAERALLLANRKKTETLYEVAPNRDPLLIDELWYGTTVRNEEEMTWAEQRLVDLGFQINIQDRVKSYINEQDTYIVYADPRAKGKITFTIYKRPLPTKSKITPALQYFQIPDNWKNDLRGKYQQRVMQALAQQ